MLESLARNHGLVDGNKRTSWVCLKHFAPINGLTLTLTADEAFTLVTGVAAGRISLTDSATVIADHLVEDD